MTNYIRVISGVADRTPVPPNLPVDSEALADLSWLDPALGLGGHAWWPEVEVQVEYDPAQQTPDGTETLTVDPESKVVRSEIGLRYLTPEELQAHRDEVLAAAQVLADSVTALVYGRLKYLSVFLYGYQNRETTALAYRDAGYEGDTDEWVNSFAEAASMPYANACDHIIAQGADMRQAVKNIESLHMGKYAILRQPTIALAQAEHDRLVELITAAVIP